MEIDIEKITTKYNRINFEFLKKNTLIKEKIRTNILIEAPVMSLIVAIKVQFWIKSGLNTASIPHILFNKVKEVSKSLEINVDRNNRVTNVIAIEIGLGIVIFRFAHHLFMQTKMPFSKPNTKWQGFTPSHNPYMKNVIITLM